MARTPSQKGLDAASQVGADPSQRPALPGDPYGPDSPEAAASRAIGGLGASLNYQFDGQNGRRSVTDILSGPTWGSFVAALHNATSGPARLVEAPDPNHPDFGGPSDTLAPDYSAGADPASSSYNPKQAATAALAKHTKTRSPWGLG